MIRIGNHRIQAGIAAKGAELQSLVALETGLQYMWSGNPAFWGKYSPILFPIIGTLKNGQFLYEGKTYTLPRHGFARDRDFILEEHTAAKAVFLLKSDARSLEVFPFDFELRLVYEVKEDQLQVTYTVSNTGKGPLYFSVGGHPAFAVPLTPDTRYEDFYLEFDQEENTPRWPISPEGLIQKESTPLLEHTNQLPITRELFQKDALVFKKMASSVVSLRSDKTAHGWSFHFGQFPFLGIWAAKGGDFVCIEPWCGIADSVDHNADLTKKEGILLLEAGELFESTWTLKVW